MKKAKTIRVEIHGDGVPRIAKDFVAFFQDKLADLSEEEQATAAICAYAKTDHSGDAYFDFTYLRPETDKEEWAREKNAEIEVEKLQLAYLQKKYGAGS